MDELLFFFDGAGAQPTIIPTDYQQSDVAVSATMPAQDPPWLDELAVQGPWPDSYQQDNVHQPAEDAFPHYVDHTTDPWEVNQSDSRANTLNTVPGVQHLPAESWPWLQEDGEHLIVPTVYQQANADAQLAQDTPILFEEWLHPTIIPLDYQQASPVARPIDTGPMFDGTNEDLDELIIDDYANLTPQYALAYEEPYAFLFQVEAHSEVFLEPGTVGVSAQSVLPADTAIVVLSMTEADLDELVIDDYANTRSDLAHEHQWDFNEEVEHFTPDLQVLPGNVTPLQPATTVILLNGLVPVVSQPVGPQFIPAPGIVEFAGYRPEIAQGVVVSPATYVLTLLGLAPTIQQHIVPGFGGILLTGGVPTVGLGRGLNPTTGALTMTGSLPSIGQPHTVVGNVGTMILQGYEPSVAIGSAFIPGTRIVLLQGYAPTLDQPRPFSPDFGAINITGYEPSVSQRLGSEPGTGFITITGYTPEVFRLTTSKNRHFDIEPEDRSIDAAQESCMKVYRFPFDPNAQLDYQFKWARWCSKISDDIGAYSITVDAGLEVVGTPTMVGNIITVFVRLDPLAPARVGSRPQVHCDIVTQSVPPRHDRRSIELHIVPR